MIMKNQLLNLKMIALMCLMMVLGGANVWAQETVTIWSEDWTGQKANATPSSINSMYSQSNSNTSVFSDNSAGGVTPELILQKKDKWIIKISDLKGCSGEFTLSYHSNRSNPILTVEVNNKSVSVSADQSDKNLYKGTFNVEKGTSNIIIAFSTTSNARIDDVVLTGIKAQTKKLTSLAISGTPTKTTYEVGEEFDPTGLVVTGTYDDNTTAPITGGITWTKNPKTMSLGNTSCTVTASVGEVNSKPFEVNGLNVVRTISLSIDPTTSTVVKAPVNVTLTATEGATVYYTTNGDEPTTSSTKYTTPFDVTVSGTTVKALAVAEGAENVTAEATYTIKPDQPLFSEESKTFKDAFNVTLSLPESTDATSSKIYYEINGAATEKSTPYNGPINISAENDGEKVILHAVVVDQYGNVGKEKYCTYTKNNAIVFDFTSDWEGITATSGSDNKTDKGQVVAGKELKVDGVVMTATSNSIYYTGLYTNKKGQTLRIYKEGSLTFTAPDGYNLSEVTFVRSSADDFNTVDEAYNNSTWTGNAHAVTFTALGSVQVKTATIKLVAAEPVQPTFGTLDFKAHDGDGFHYATFSSDKDVVFNHESVEVYAVSVSNEKVDMNPLADASYNVTDATVGSIEKGYYVPANTGVLIVGYDATTTYYFPAEAQTVTLPANQLKPAPANGGVFEATTGYKYYKLAYDDFDNKTGLGFYWGAPEGGKFFVKAGTAYLAVPAGDATAKGFAFNGEATGIEGVNANVENAKAIYNLNGQRVASMAKPGLYIVNGKKMVVRK